MGTTTELRTERRTMMMGTLGAGGAVRLGEEPELVRETTFQGVPNMRMPQELQTPLTPTTGRTTLELDATLVRTGGCGGARGGLRTSSALLTTEIPILEATVGLQTQITPLAMAMQTRVTMGPQLGGLTK